MTSRGRLCATARLLAFGLAFAAPLRAEVRSVRFVVQDEGLSEGRLETGPSTGPTGLVPSRSAEWLSPVLDPGGTFTAVGPHWRGAPGVALEIAVSPDGLRWGAWIAVPADHVIAPLREDGTPNPFAGDTLGALVFVSPDSRYLRCRVELPATRPGETALRRLAFHVIDPGTDPGTLGPETGEGSAHRTATVPERARAPEPELPEPATSVRKPPFVAREAWGARPPKYAYTTTLAGRVGVHHTASVEDFTAGTRAECAARMRAIQAFHMETNGWNDVGYAWAICRHGDVFQGREDDDDSTDVQGAHDGFNRGSVGVTLFGYFHPPVDQRPTAAQLSSLIDVVSWIASLRDFDPLGRSPYEAFGGPVDNVYGHREVKATDCPGDHLFARKEEVRAAASERVLRFAW